MAVTLECDICEHEQLVALIPNGLAGHGDPHAICENCGTTGSFHSFPGSARRTRALVADLASRVQPLGELRL